MISYRQATNNDFNLIFTIKSNSTKHLVEKIWGWEDDIQLDYHKKQFNPIKIKIIINNNKEVGYISTLVTDDIFFIENIIIDIPYQGKNIGTKVLLDCIKFAKEQEKRVELQVLTVNVRAKKLYERLNFETFEQTELHYKMRLKQN